jgi:hypothetical protein
MFRSIRQLFALSKSDADLPEESEAAPEASPEAKPEPVAAPAGPDVPEKPNSNPDKAKGSDKLASVGAPAQAEVRPGRSEAPAGTPGRPGGPTGTVPGPKKPPKRS